MGRPSKLEREKGFEALYLVRAEDRSTYEVESFFKKEYGIDIDHSNISRLVRALDNEITKDADTRRAFEEWKTSRGTEKKFYRVDPVTQKVESDYATVQSFINERSLRAEGEGDMRSVLDESEKCWLFLEKKDPANWELQDVRRFLAEGKTLSHKAHTANTKFDYMVACRAVAPRVMAAKNATREYKKQMQKDYPVILSSVFTKEYKEIIYSDKLDDNEKFAFMLHVVTGAREGSKLGLGEKGEGRASVLGIKWSDYDARTETLSVFESKQVGRWNNIPLDVLDPSFRKLFREKWEKLGRPAEGSVLGIDYDQLNALYAKIRMSFGFLKGKRFSPHFGRKTHVNILWESGVPLEIIAGNAKGHQGYVGVGWTDLKTLKDHYLALSESKLDEYRQKAKEHFSKV